MLSHEGEGPASRFGAHNHPGDKVTHACSMLHCVYEVCSDSYSYPKIELESHHTIMSSNISGPLSNDPSSAYPCSQTRGV